MTRDDVYAQPSNSIVKLLDGFLGLLLLYPDKEGEMEGKCGIQVPGEDYHRWIHHDNLQAKAEGALVEIEDCSTTVVETGTVSNILEFAKRPKL